MYCSLEVAHQPYKESTLEVLAEKVSYACEERRDVIIAANCAGETK